MPRDETSNLHPVLKCAASTRGQRGG